MLVRKTGKVNLSARWFWRTLTQPRDESSSWGKTSHTSIRKVLVGLLGKVWFSTELRFHRRFGALSVRLTPASTGVLPSYMTFTALTYIATGRVFTAFFTTR